MHSGMAKTPLNRAIEGDSVKSLDSDGKAAIKTASFSRNPGVKLYSYIYEIGNAPTLQCKDGHRLSLVSLLLVFPSRCIGL